MILRYIRTKQIYNLRIKDFEGKEWVTLSTKEIKKYGVSDFERLLSEGKILRNETNPNQYATHEIGDYDLSLLSGPFYKESLYLKMYEYLLMVRLDYQTVNPDLLWFDMFMKYGANLKSLFFKVDSFSGRIHTPITNLKKGYRAEIKLNGENVNSLDVATMQPLLLAKVLHDNIGENDYSRFVFDGNDIYMRIMDKFSIKDRSQAKERFYSLLFSNINNDLCGLFVNHAWIDWINDFKSLRIAENPSNEQKPYTNLVWLLQNYEVKIMKGIWERLIEEDIPFLSVHDEIIVSNKHCLDAFGIMQENLERELGTVKINIH